MTRPPAHSGAHHLGGRTARGCGSGPRLPHQAATMSRCLALTTRTIRGPPVTALVVEDYSAAPALRADRQRRRSTTRSHRGRWLAALQRETFRYCPGSRSQACRHDRLSRHPGEARPVGESSDQVSPKQLTTGMAGSGGSRSRVSGFAIPLTLLDETALFFPRHRAPPSRTAHAGEAASADPPSPRRPWWWTTRPHIFALPLPRAHRDDGDPPRVVATASPAPHARLDVVLMDL